MPFSPLPLSYCTNVHPGRTVAEVEDGLTRYTARLQERVGQPIAAGLWLANSVARELSAEPGRLQRLRTTLSENGLVCYTLNTFPYGDFHSPRVKENVYLPDWSDSKRLGYTGTCARILAELMPDGVDGSLSTVPLGFKEFSASNAPGFRQACIAQLLQLAEELADIAVERGQTIRLAIEPEPFCLLETTPETIAFFEELFAEADRRLLGNIAREFLGVCYDVCHQAVEFEDIPASLRSLQGAGIRINKVHITCAIELDNPAANVDGRRLLAGYAEERYLHQTLAVRHPEGNENPRPGPMRCVDLTKDMALNPPPEFLNAEAWRIHFHVPVNLETLGPGLRTTRPELRQALESVGKLPYLPHLEVETYTWPVLPGTTGDRDESLVAGLAAELGSTRDLIREASGL